MRAVHHEEERIGSKIDLVCGIHLKDMPQILTRTYKDRDYFFCGEGCLDRFTKNPVRYLGTPFIHLEGVSKSFGSGALATSVLHNVDIHIWEGDFVSIIGPSGSGKSTLLNMMGLLDTPTKGTVFVRGVDASHLSNDAAAALRSNVFGFVFQQYNLIPWLNAYENATIPLTFAGHTNNEQRLSSIKARFQEMGLGERMTHKPAELSGGEQQRVALMRALANDPAIIFGDEPTGNLDSKTGNMLLEALITLNRTQGKTLVIVTHDKDIAERADEVITLRDGVLVPDHHIHKKTYTE